MSFISKHQQVLLVRRVCCMASPCSRRPLPPTWRLSEDMVTSLPVCLSRFSSCDTTTWPSCVRWQSSSSICVPCSTALRTGDDKSWVSFSVSRSSTPSKLANIALCLQPSAKWSVLTYSQCAINFYLITSISNVAFSYNVFIIVVHCNYKKILIVGSIKVFF